MATTSGSNRTDPDPGGDEPTARARTAAEQRAQRTSGSNDPEVLADEIERTREELAETLDAIADKVSPKRVKERTKKKVTDSVKETADAAKEHLHTGAASAKDKAEHAKEQLQDKADHAKAAVQEKVDQAHDKGSGSGETGDPFAVAVAPTPGTLADQADVVAVVEPVGADVPPVDPLRTDPAVGGIGGVQTYGASPSVPKEALAGGAAALAVVLLVLRRRKRTRARGWKRGAKR